MDATETPRSSSADRSERRRAKREAFRRVAFEDSKVIIREGLDAYVLGVGLQAFHNAMEEETREICGPKGQHNRERQAVRFGSAPGSATLFGRKVKIIRPRLRSADGKEEIRLAVYDAAHQAQSLEATIIEASLCGVSQRKFGDRLQPVMVPMGSLETFGVAKSTVNRHFVQATLQASRELAERPIAERYPVLFLDGIEYGHHLVVAALGVREDGRKSVLGLHEGTTENAEACQTLLEDLVARGLNDDGLLVVIDGGKGLAAAVGRVFGERAVVQRCRAAGRTRPETSWRSYPRPSGKRSVMDCGEPGYSMIQSGPSRSCSPWPAAWKNRAMKPPQPACGKDFPKP